MPVLFGLRWPSVGGVTTITWSFAAANFASLQQQNEDYRNFDSFIAAAFRATIRSAFSAWEAVADIHFVESPDGPDVGIRFGNVFVDGRPTGGSTLAETFFFYVGTSFKVAQIYFDVDAYDDPADLYEIAVHEIGHAIGLDHSSLPSAVMYSELNAQNASGQLTADDIRGAQLIYGGAPGAPSQGLFDDYTSTSLTTGSVAVGGSASGLIEVEGDIDWLRVTLEAGRDYRIDVEGAPSGPALADPVVEVYGANGLLLAMYDDSPGSRNSRGVFSVATGGTFYLAVSGFPGEQSVGAYRVTLTEVARPPGDDHAGSTATTSTIGVGGGVATGSIETVGDVDWLRVTFAAGHTYRIDVEGAPSVQGTLPDSFVEVHGPLGQLLDYYDDGGTGRDSRGEFTASSSGVHYLAVSSYPDGGAMVGTYRVSVVDVTSAGAMAPSIQTAGSNILRGVSNPAINDLAGRVVAGSITESAAIAEIVQLAAATTSVATLSYQFFTGKIPGLGGIDYLVSPTGPNPNNINSAYYQSFNLENRYINFAVNLGRDGDGKAAFLAAYGNLSLFEATRTAYATIFGGTPSDAKLHALLDPVISLGGQTFTRGEYFAIYGGDGPNGIGTKAAMVGFLLAEAVKADLGVYAKVNDAFLIDLADGATFAIDIVGAYNRPEYVFNPG